METTRVAGISSLRPAAVQDRGHPLPPQRLYHNQRGGLLRGTGHHRPAPYVQYFAHHKGTVKHDHEYDFHTFSMLNRFNYTFLFFSFYYFPSE